VASAARQWRRAPPPFAREFPFNGKITGNFVATLLRPKPAGIDKVNQILTVNSSWTIETGIFGRLIGN
jgi:hypothetical protein